MTGTILLAARELAFATPSGRPLVRGLNIHLGEGEILAVTGPNGSGKTTLLRVLLGEAAKTAGTVELGVPRQRIGYLPQLHNREFHLPLTLRDVLGLAVPGRLDEALAVGYGLLAKAQLGRAWNSASGGERQRALLTATLLAAPRLLVLDEPLNHLDQDGRLELRAALERFAGEPGHAVLLVAHERALAGWERTRQLSLLGGRGS